MRSYQSTPSLGQFGTDSICHFDLRWADLQVMVPWTDWRWAECEEEKGWILAISWRRMVWVREPSVRPLVKRNRDVVARLTRRSMGTCR